MNSSANLSNSTVNTEEEEWILLPNYQAPVQSKLDSVILNAPSEEEWSALENAIKHIKNDKKQAEINKKLYQQQESKEHKEDIEMGEDEIEIDNKSNDNNDNDKNNDNNDVDDEDQIIEDEPENTFAQNQTNNIPNLSTENSSNDKKSVKFSDPEAEEDEDSKDAVAPDPLYDPTADSDDEQWTNKNVRLTPSKTDDITKPSNNHKNQINKTENSESDALLSCPNCFLEVCFDCQRHTRYHQQFRAIHTINTKIDKSNQTRPEVGDDDNTDTYYNVVCEACNTVLGIIDKDEIYHLFNVLESTT